MKNLDSNKAFQNILKNAPEMPMSQIPDENPKSGNEYAGLVLSIAVIFVGQILMLLAMDKLIKGTSGKINYTPKKPMRAEDTLPSTEKETPPTEVKS